MSRNHLSTEKLTNIQIEKALDQIIEWFPEEAENISSDKEELIALIANDKTPEPNSPLLLIKPAITTESEFYELPSLTPCEQACGMVIFDVVLFVIGLFGLHVSNQEN